MTLQPPNLHNFKSVSKIRCGLGLPESTKGHKGMATYVKGCWCSGAVTPWQWSLKVKLFSGVGGLSLRGLMDPTRSQRKQSPVFFLGDPLNNTSADSDKCSHWVPPIVMLKEFNLVDPHLHNPGRNCCICQFARPLC